MADQIKFTVLITAKIIITSICAMPLKKLPSKSMASCVETTAY